MLLTSGDVDQVAGLLSLRELHEFRIYCTRSLRRILRDDNNMFAMLNRVSRQVSWVDIHMGQSFPLLTASGDGVGSPAKHFP